MGFFPPLYETVVNILIYVAIGVLMILAENNKARIKLGVAAAGFFALLALFPNDFFLVQALIVAWLVLLDFKMIVSKQIMIALLIIMVAGSFVMPWFFFITFLFYVITLGGFIIGTFKKLISKVKNVS